MTIGTKVHQKRVGLFGYSHGIYNPRKPVKNPTLTLRPALDLISNDAGGAWRSNSARRLQLAADAVADSDELLGLLEENLQAVQFNRYNLEV
jgi:hypothetical protein